MEGNKLHWFLGLLGLEILVFFTITNYVIGAMISSGIIYTLFFHQFNTLGKAYFKYKEKEIERR